MFLSCMRAAFWSQTCAAALAVCSAQLQYLTVLEWSALTLCNSPFPALVCLFLWLLFQIPLLMQWTILLPAEESLEAVFLFFLPSVCTVSPVQVLCPFPQPALRSAALLLHSQVELQVQLLWDLFIETVFLAAFKSSWHARNTLLKLTTHCAEKKSHTTPLIWFLGYLNFLSAGLGCCSFFPLFVSALLRMLLGSYFWPRQPSLGHFASFLSLSLPYLGFWALFNTFVDYQVNFLPSSSAL